MAAAAWGEWDSRGDGGQQVARRYACLLFFVMQRTALARFCELGWTATGLKGRAKVTQKNNEPLFERFTNVIHSWE